ncbi:uncharacterized protein LOC126984167 [Eriocheir sinensis]|uniref:uncharacterized protein LOC126984167 n=1 Tax=Eriocheir sinensis TaxID=95602 RepID=UPI0021CAC198|nr:uncharacterized protein LOC126984167 [Eriocheir sinensis]
MQRAPHHKSRARGGQRQGMKREGTRVFARLHHNTLSSMHSTSAGARESGNTHKGLPSQETLAPTLIPCQAVQCHLANLRVKEVRERQTTGESRVRVRRVKDINPSSGVPIKPNTHLPKPCPASQESFSLSGEDCIGGKVAIVGASISVTIWPGVESRPGSS